MKLNSHSHLVGPLSHSYAAAGFFPKQNKTATTCENIMTYNTHDDEEEQESVYNQSKYWLIEDNCVSEQEEKGLIISGNDVPKKPKLNKQFLRCLQTSNLRNNFLYWDAKSKEPKATSPQPPPKALTSTSITEDNDDDDCVVEE